MDSPDDQRILDSIRLYRETLIQTKNLFVSCGQEISQEYPWLIDADTDIGFPDQMYDLHCGFVMKVFSYGASEQVAHLIEQRQLGRVLLTHLWGEPLFGAKLKEAVDWLITEADRFEWSDLVQPFVVLPPLRDRWGEVMGLAGRMANLIAKSDGLIGTADAARLSQLQTDLDRIESASSERHSHEHSPAAAVVHQIRTESDRIAGRTETTTATSSMDVPPRLSKESSKKNPTTPEQRLAKAQAKLNELIGLDNIKQQVSTLANFLQLEARRKVEGLPSTETSLHMAFVGNPGTGKTTVARIIADIFGALGVLKQGHLIETDRSGLVAEFAGQTGPKTNAKIDEAIDGVLFIDEAYALIDPSGQDQYGREAIQTLLKRMEDQRDRLVVILAGYPDEMRTMIRSNPGLSSRVGTTLEFVDYEPVELARIFSLICDKAKYELPGESRRRILHGLTLLYATRDRHFGNGRTARNAFERSIRRLANRLAPRSEISIELLTTLQPQDIEIPHLSDDQLDELVAMQMNLKIDCHECSTTFTVDDSVLATEVSCTQCRHTFVAQWGELVPHEQVSDSQDES